MKRPVVFIDTESGRMYNLTDPAEIALLREDLDKKGFFGMGENRKYYDWFDRIITVKEFEDFVVALRLFNAILISKRTGKLPGNGLLN